MDIIDIHERMQTPSKFHVPDYNHKAHIQVTVHKNNERNHTEQHLNDIKLYNNDDLMHENNSSMNEIFNNVEEEIIFNYDEIDETNCQM